jgi:hypothetical protein
MKGTPDPSAWPDHLQVVFALVERGLAGRRLSPDIVEQLPSGFGSIIPDHSVTVAHLSGEAAGPAGNRYEIMIDGPRIIGSWSFRSGELEKLARASATGDALKV